jgi:putative ABC transport system ATP-binding protein
VLVVTHDHRLVPFADKVFEMADGRLRTDTEVAHVFDPAKDTGSFKMDKTMEHRPLPPAEPEPDEVPVGTAKLWEPVYVM